MTDVADSVARTFLTQMLSRHGLQAEPIVALLGPRGAGKTPLLAALSQQCAGTVIHAAINFSAHDFDPIQAAAYISFEMMRGWETTRQDPSFHRFALGLLARNEDLAPSRPLARRQISDLVQQYVRNTKQGEAADWTGDLVGLSLAVAVKSLGHLASPPLNAMRPAQIRAAAKPVIGSLFQRAARLTVLRALRYYREIPAAQSASAYDSLIRLSRADPAEAIKTLLDALLADMAGHVTQHRPLRAACECVTPAGQPVDGRHTHAWVLLVDGAESPAGRKFLTALAAARAERIQAGQFDPLLVVAAYGQWDSRWHTRWCEPWCVLPRPGLAQQRIPTLTQATYELWAKDSSAALACGDVDAAWFPVWLDALSPKQTAALITPGATILGVPQLAHRLTGGLPGALLALQDQLSAVSSGTARKVSVPGELLIAETQARPPLWWRWAKDALPAELLAPAGPAIAIPRTAIAAAYLADALAAQDDEIPDGLPGLQDLLDLLRQHLWLTTFAAVPSRLAPVTATTPHHPATLHPWLARCLLAAAATSPWVRDDQDEPLPDKHFHPRWKALFEPLAPAVAAPSQESPDSHLPPNADPDRVLYYELALQEELPPDQAAPERGFLAVVSALARSFNAQDHRLWVGRLDYITSAPSRLPLHLSTEDAYNGLMTGQDERAVVDVATAKLVALLWLYRDPLTEHTRRWDHEIRGSFLRLLSCSKRADTSALGEAGDCF